MNSFTKKAPARIFSVAATIGLITAFSGCPADRTTDDFRHDEAQSEMARMKQANGTYTGQLTSMNGQVIGSASIVLNSEITPTVSSNYSQSEPIVTIEGTINLFLGDGSSRSLNFQNAYYDPTTGDFSASSVVTVSTGSAGSPPPDGGGSSGPANQTTIQIKNGLVKDSTFTGTLFAEGYDTYGATFNLSKNTDPSEAQSLSKVAALPPSFLASAKTYFSSGVTIRKPIQSRCEPSTRPVQMIIDQTDIAPEEKFADVFNPIKTVSITLSYTDAPPSCDSPQGGGPGSRIAVGTSNPIEASWDQTKNTITGYSYSPPSSSGSANYLRLDCKPVGGSGFNCIYSSGFDGGEVWRGAFSPQN